MTTPTRHIPAVFLLGIFILIPTLSPTQEVSESTRKVVNRVVPQYPQMARTMKLKGSVKVEATVEPNGAVKSVEIKGGHPVLAQSAENAVLKWKWQSDNKETHELVEIKFNPE